MQSLLRALLVLPLALTLASAQQEPPRRLDFSGEAAEQPQAQDSARATTREMRTKFVRSQTILGLTAYGPTFSAMVADDGVTAVAGYLVMAGGSFFAATELTRQFEITPARQFLSSRMAWRGTLDGLVLGNVWDVRYRSTAGLGWIGGVSGTALGLVIARDMREGEAVSMAVAHDIVYLSTLALGLVIDPNDGDGGLSPQARGVSATVLGWGGYALGRAYSRRAMYEVTDGDALLLWVGAGIGATTLGTFVAESDPSPQVVAGTILAGSLVGIWGADRWLVRRFDHSTAEGSLVALGGGAGALMGIGVGVLIAGEAERGASITLGLASLGAIGGVMLTERYAQPAMDGGRSFDVGRVEFTPLGAVAAAAGVQGRHSILRITF